MNFFLAIWIGIGCYLIGYAFDRITLGWGLYFIISGLCMVAQSLIP